MLANLLHPIARWCRVGAALFRSCALRVFSLLSSLFGSARRRQSEMEAALIADLSSRFVNLSAHEVDREIEDAQRKICEFLDIDLSALWQWSDGSPGFFKLTHLYSAQEGPRPSDSLRQEDFPWCAEQLLAGRVVSISSLNRMPPEAAHDRESARKAGIKSALTLPLSAGGGSPIGVLGFNTTRAERPWPEAQVKRLLVVAQIFANALARKRADQALRESEEALRASETRLAAGTELAGLGYYEVDYGERRSFLDDRFRQICGVPPEVTQGLKPVEFWLEHVHPEDRQRVLDERQELHDGRVQRISTEYRYQHPDQGLRWIHHLARIAGPSAVAGGVRTFGVVRDITPQKKADFLALELRDRLAHADRVSLLGQLASALAHELSQPLGAILRNAEAAEIMLRSPSPDLEELRAVITDILRDDTRAGQVIDRLRSLLKRQSMNLQPIDLPGVIAAVLHLIQANAAASHVRLDYLPAPGLPRVRGDSIHLQQVVLNLVVNAMDALAGCTDNERFVRVRARQTGPATVEVRVSDNGPGFPAEAFDRLFEPFFTTKANGMGIGLAVSKTIIEAHKGRIWAEKSAEGGACFCFSLPVSEGTK